MYVFSSEPAQTYTIEHDQGNQLPPQNDDWTTTIQDLRFVHNGKYVCGYVETSQDLVSLLESYRVISRPAKSHALGVTLTPQSTISRSHAWTHPEWRNLTPAAQLHPLLQIFKQIKFKVS